MKLGNRAIDRARQTTVALCLAHTATSTPTSIPASTHACITASIFVNRSIEQMESNFIKPCMHQNRDASFDLRMESKCKGECDVPHQRLL